MWDFTVVWVTVRWSAISAFARGRCSAEIREVDLRAFRRRVATNVRERFLGGSVDGQLRVRLECPRLAVDGNRYGKAALLREVLGEHAEPVRAGQLVAAGGRDRSTSLLQSVRRQLVCVVDRKRQLLAGALPRR